jgi:hypothetical protein
MDFMVVLTVYPFTEEPRFHVTNWIDNWLSQKIDENTAAKGMVPHP